MKIKTRKYLFLATAVLFFSILDVHGQDKEKLENLTEQVLEAQKSNNNKLADSLAQVYIKEYLFKLRNQDLFTSENLNFLSQHLSDIEGKAFKLFLKAPEKVNSILGKDKAEYLVRIEISKKYFKDIEADKNPDFDWTSLEKKMLSKFGEIGLETLYGKQMIYYMNAKEWDNFGKYYMLYFEKALKRPEYNINDVTWVLFENVSNSKIIKFACDVVMKYAMEEWYTTNYNAYDTYANLLYKTGQKEKAIEWEEKAVKLSKNDKTMIETLEKMKNDLKSSLETVNN